VTPKDATEGTDVDQAAGDETGDETSSAAEKTEDNEDNAPDPQDRVVRRTLRGARARIGVILLAAALVASAGVTSWLFFFQYRPDREIDAGAAKVALDAASKGSVALLTYSPDSLDKDFAAAKSHLTGDFLAYYTQFTEQIVTPAAKQKSVKTSAAVVREAVSELHPDSAVVLVFVNQNTTSKENPDGAFASSTVKVGMKKIGGTWLISSFDPV
jgi:Mce-associated membrane protein